jgi:transcription initiation factor TFIID TATA-box-binding protein
VYRLAQPKVTMQIFASGKIVLTGAKDPADIQRAFDMVGIFLNGLGWLDSRDRG